MSIHQATPEQIRRFKILTTLVLGACILMLGDFVFDAWVKLVLEDSAALTWKQYGAILSPLVGVGVMMVVAYRVLRHSMLPGIISLVSLTGAMFAVVLLNRG